MKLLSPNRMVRMPETKKILGLEGIVRNDEKEESSMKYVYEGHTLEAVCGDCCNCKTKPKDTALCTIKRKLIDRYDKPCDNFKGKPYVKLVDEVYYNINKK